MSGPPFQRPESAEYDSSYAGYIARVPEGDLLATLERQSKETAAFVAGLPGDKADFAYAPGKWTVKEVLGHIADGERVFAYRALRFARGDKTPLPGFDEQTWVPQSGASERRLEDLSAELRAVRAATLALLRGFPPGADQRSGTANGRPISVRALAWIIAGHERHHLSILRERYLA